ncbi:hypothetical protein V5N11_026662 [Cardamine amara subsp. amara]|uniref:GRF-type domain-containing protein n=1 Tax=Cardamine amara subsp. amara TaxID=228776 RepID=A0ABD1ARF4_CARAN
MSNISGASSGSSSAHRGRIVGVPRVCWCGAQIVAKLSKSETNPYRRYFRCVYAASNKLMDDNHIFKWVDEALLNEVDSLTSKAERLEQMVKENEIVFDGAEYEKIVYEKVLMEVEKEVFERVETVLMEAKASVKKMMILPIIGCMLIVGFMKLI